MSTDLELPAWGEYLTKLGRALATLPPTEYGEPAFRIALSVPSGRFTYWFLTAGAMSVDRFPEPRPTPGDVAATWVNSRMQDVDLKDGGPGIWRLAPGRSVFSENWPATKVHPDTPEDRKGTKLPPRYRDGLSALPGRSGDWYVWYSMKCLTPVIIVGTGRDHIQQQRQVLLQEAPHWFDIESAALLNEDSGGTSEPKRTLFHPFMVFDAGVGAHGPWLREMLPRLVVTTSWSSRKRMHPALFSRAPQVIITNRRVRSETEAMFELSELTPYEGLDDIVNDGRPESIAVSVFAETAQGEADGDEEWEFML